MQTIRNKIFENLLDLLPSNKEYITQSDLISTSGNINTYRNKIKNRIYFVIFFFFTLYCILIFKTLLVGLNINISSFLPEIIDKNSYIRGLIYDRNGKIMASHLKIANLIVDPKQIENPDEAYDRISEIFPDILPSKLERVLYYSNKRYALLERNITPSEQQKVHDLGIPGVSFENHNMRFYPQSNIASHILGVTDIDQKGIAGIEKTFDNILSGENLKKKDITLSVDMRIQDILHDNISETINLFNASGGAGIIMNANTGEIYALASLPDFNPNIKIKNKSSSLFNRATVGSYEMGSTFKVINTAIGYDTNTILPDDQFDVSKHFKIGKYSIKDFHPVARPLTATEILQKSSNIGSVKIANLFGPHVQKYYMKRLGLLDRMKIEIPENGAPIIPPRWKKTEMATISYGHGLAVTPLQLTSAIATIVNGGKYVQPTLKLRSNDSLINKTNQTHNNQLNDLIKLWNKGDNKSYYKNADSLYPNVQKPSHGQRIFSNKASELTKYAMRKVCESGGTGRRADVPGYPVLGKTGTSEKHLSNKRGYDDKALISSFVGAFPAQDPEFIIYVMIDEPKPNLEISPYATGGVVAAPVARKTIEQIAPMLNISPIAPYIHQDSLSEYILPKDISL